METAAVRQGRGSMWRLVCVAAVALLGVIRLMLGREAVLLWLLAIVIGREIASSSARV